MIHSEKIQKELEVYKTDALYEMLKAIFTVTYIKTYSNCGFYIWLGGDYSEFNKNIMIDQYSPSCTIKMHDKQSQNLSDSLHIFIFLNHTEDEVVRKIKLKAFI